MSRSSKRRQIIEAARRLVARRGAAHLTFEELTAESKLSRGGIVYHFPTRERLLQAVIAFELHEWDHAAPGDDDPDVWLDEAHLTHHLSGLFGIENPSMRVAGLLTAAASDPELLDQVRLRAQRRFLHWSWDDAGMRRFVALMAAEGLFWRKVFGLNPLPDAKEALFRDAIEVLLGDAFLADPAGAPRN